MRDGIGPVTARKIKSHLIEFFLVGLLMGITEDLLAIHFATDAKITLHVVWVAFLVALPFAVISELLVDFGVFRQYIRAKKHDYFNSPKKPSPRKQKSLSPFASKPGGASPPSGNKG